MRYSEKADIKMKEFKKTYFHKDTEIMTLTIKYPVISLFNNHDAEAIINNQIAIEVNEYYRYVSNFLYEQAVKSYKDSKESDFPFFGYEAYMEYTITYNENCFLSYYYDKYEFTGGAHGSTLRNSNTFALSTGTSIPLYCLFNEGTDYKRMLTFEMINQADRRLKETPGIYFEDYEILIIKHFDKNNYFLSPKGLSIYYQQYDIAPYSTGIVVFTIPYEQVGWYPNCC